MPQILVWLVSILARGSKEVEALSAPHVVRRRWYLFVAVVLTLLLPFTYALSHTMMGWLNLSAVVELPHALWKVAYGFPSTTCGLNATSTPSCLANPDNSQLWQSRWHRGDQVAHSNRLKENLSAEYWLGVEINADQQKTAYEHEANFLVLGNLRSTFRIWVDGLQIMHGTYRDNEPTAVQLPLEWLARGKPMRIAINMVPEPGVGGNDTDVPDYLEEPPILGLSTKAGTTGWREHQYFWLMARPMAFLVLNFILGWIFFGLWRVAPEKTEYFYIALFAITFALFQMRSLGLFYLALPRKFITTMGAIVAIFNSVVGMLVGFSFARFRRELMSAGLLLCLALCAAVPFLNMIQQMELSTFWVRHASNVCMGLGGLACYLQAYYLSTRRVEGLFLRKRIMRLLLFGSGLIGLIAMSRINTYSAVPSVIQVLFSRSGPLFLLLSLGLIALSEYHNEHSLAKSMPVSKFHLLNPLPAAVKGVILNVDLKGSEHLSRLSARLGHSGDLMETCLSHLWTAVSEHDGLVMQTEGDSLRALFADGDHNNSLIAAFEALDAMKRNLTKLSKRFASQGLAASLPREGLNFRASLAAGEIRPIWQDYGGVRLASWTETSGTNVFTDAARLLELERQIQSEMNSPASIVITPAELRARFTVGSSQGVWLFDRRSFVGKHGAAYEVAAYRVGEK